jgi:hypothetical protein
MQIREVEEALPVPGLEVVIADARGAVAQIGVKHSGLPREAAEL